MIDTKNSLYSQGAMKQVCAGGRRVPEKKPKDCFLCERGVGHDEHMTLAKDIEDEEEDKETYWERRKRIFEENIELTQEMCKKRRIMEEARQRQEAMYGDEEAGRSGGVPASELLSML